MDSQAYVTLVTSDDYALGAVVLARSLRNTGTQRRLAVMVTPNLSTEARIELANVFDALHQVELLNSHDIERLHLLRRPELGVTFTKICVWTLEQYSKVVYLDADTLVVQNVDDLFDREELSASPDVGWPDCFNSGVFVAKPSLATYDALLSRAQDEGSFDGGDQGLLNQHFPQWTRLPFLYNVVPGTFYSYSPAYRHFIKDVKIIHFIGPLKPWMSDRPAPGATGEGHDLQMYWWSVYDVHHTGGPSPLLRGPRGPAPSTISAAGQHWFNRPARSSSSSSTSSQPGSPLKPSPWERAQTPAGEEIPYPIDFSAFPYSERDAETLTRQVDAAEDNAAKRKMLGEIREELRKLNGALRHESSIEARAPGTIDSIHERVSRLTHVLMKFKFYGQ